MIVVMIGNGATDGTGGRSGCSADDGRFQTASEDGAQSRSAGCADYCPFSRTYTAPVVMVTPLILVDIAVVVALPDLIVHAAVVIAALLRGRGGRKEQRCCDGQDTQGCGFSQSASERIHWR